MENAKRTTFFIISYALSVAQLNFIEMILLINQWCLESQKALLSLVMSKKLEREVFNKGKISKIMLGKKR